MRTFVDASDPDKDSSPVASFTAKTAAQTPLQAPVVTVNTSSAIPTAKWELVENADYYEYTYSGGSLSAPVTGTDTEGMIYLRNLLGGDYKLTVVAHPSNEWYAPSQTSVNFTIGKEEKARYNGTFTVANYPDPDSEWSADIVVYTDGSYSILAWYGVEGYNLDFCKSGSDLVFTNCDYDDEWYIVPCYEGFNAYLRSLAGMVGSRGQITFEAANIGVFTYKWQ